MKKLPRRERMRVIWRESHGVLSAGDRIAVLGAGISGLHLAFFLRQRGFEVTLFEPRAQGGVAIPVMHACNTRRRPQPLWEKAAAFSRLWYRTFLPAAYLYESANEFGAYFCLRTRSYQRALRHRLQGLGVPFVRSAGAAPGGYHLVCAATGSATTGVIDSRIIPGWESYFSRQERLLPAENPLLLNHAHGTYMPTGRRAAFVHKNSETRASAERFARLLHPQGRHALFYGERMATRDRMPVVGFSGAAGSSPFLFCGMGYHGMTYSPYLAHAVAAQLAGDTPVDENLVCTLTPARFLPRN